MENESSIIKCLQIKIEADNAALQQILIDYNKVKEIEKNLRAENQFLLKELSNANDRIKQYEGEKCAQLVQKLKKVSAEVVPSLQLPEEGKFSI